MQGRSLSSRIFLPTLPVIAMSVLAATGAQAAESASAFDRIWSAATIVGDRRAGDYPVLKLRGRYQGQGFIIDAGDEGDDDGFQTRRLRLGMDAHWNADLKLSFDLNLSADSSEPFVKDFDYLTVDWQMTPRTKLTVGKVRRMRLTAEDGTSSNSILTVERSLAAQSVGIANLGGLVVQHRYDGWDLAAGVFSGGLDDDLVLPDGEGGLGYQINIGNRLGANSRFRIDYLNTENDEDNVAFSGFRHTLSVNTNSEWGRWGLVTDLILAEPHRDGRGDLIGVVLLPSVKLQPKLIGVLRYTFLRSGKEDGIRLASRYERRADNLIGERGQQHQALYAGLNYYIYGQKLKVMFGAEYAQLTRGEQGRFEGVTGLGALRMYF